MRYGSGVGSSLAGFLGSMITRTVGSSRGTPRTLVHHLGGWACLPPSTATHFNRLFRLPAALSLLRHRIAPRRSTGMFTRSTIGLAARLSLRTRLTLIRLALIRKPWSYGGEVSRLPCRYLYLHLLFRALQHASWRTFGAARNAPLPTTLTLCGSTSSAPDLCPIIIHAGPLDR